MIHFFFWIVFSILFIHLWRNLNKSKSLPLVKFRCDFEQIPISNDSISNTFIHKNDEKENRPINEETKIYSNESKMEEDYFLDVLFQPPNVSHEFIPNIDNKSHLKEESNLSDNLVEWNIIVKNQLDKNMDSYKSLEKAGSLGSKMTEELPPISKNSVHNETSKCCTSTINVSPIVSLEVPLGTNSLENFPSISLNESLSENLPTVDSPIHSHLNESVVYSLKEPDKEEIPHSQTPSQNNENLPLQPNIEEKTERDSNLNPSIVPLQTELLSKEEEEILNNTQVSEEEGIPFFDFENEHALRRFLLLQLGENESSLSQQPNTTVSSTPSPKSTTKQKSIRKELKKNISSLPKPQNKTVELSKRKKESFSSQKPKTLDLFELKDQIQPTKKRIFFKK